MTTGLFLGKFAPFHRGHGYVVETALAEVDDLLVFAYDAPDVTPVPLSVRADWIRESFPSVEVLEAWTGPTGTGYTEAEKRRHEEYILERLDGRDVDRFYSSEPYGEHVSEALDAVDRRVDPGRETVPISGTRIREDPHGHREYVPDHVYSDLVTNVALVGGPSTGKTTLARRLAGEYGTGWMPEHGREYWERHNVDGRLSPAQLLELAEEHLEREDAKLLEADTYLFTDTNAITTYVWSRYYHGEAPEGLYELARSNAVRYDVTILCGTDVPYDHEAGRSGPANRVRIQKMTRAFLDRYDIPYYEVAGDVAERVDAVGRILDRAAPWSARRESPPE